MSGDEPTAGTHDSVRFARMRDIFERACEARESERAALVERECAGDAALRREVLRLLEASDEVGDRFDPDQGALVGSVFDAPARAHPEQIGPYRIRREIGRGGMGVVYLAEQSNPQREVALKILHSGRRSASLRSRFGREVRVLARLEHAGITRIYEAGTAQTLDGPVSFFAMEYVRGLPITAYANQAAIDTRVRVEVVARIADAVQHAHTKGVIHRDLKPANILMDDAAVLVPHRDASSISSATTSASRAGFSTPHPKILDFGVARLLEPDTQHTALTEAGLLVGTVSYMSPEQLAGDIDAVDARSDVYAMGVILYELLAGRMPHDLRGKPIAEAARIIRDVEPDPLAGRGLVAPRAIDRDLATITFKAMAKDRDRRYPTAAALADDLRRYLRDEPIQARPATATYQLGKFARRNRGLVAGAATALLALVAGLVVSTGLYFREQHARELADQKDRLSTAVRDYLINTLLLAATPGRQGYDVKMLDVLTRASDGLHERFAESPDVEGSIRADLGNALSQIGKLKEGKEQYLAAIPLVERAFGPDHVNTITTIVSLGTTLQKLHEDEAWLATGRDAMARAERSLAENHEQRLRAMTHIGGALVTLGRYDEARPVLEAGLAIAEREAEKHWQETGAFLSWLTACETAAGRAESALGLRRKNVDLNTRVNGADHYMTLIARAGLAQAMRAAGKLDEALAVIDGVPQTMERHYPPGHPVRGQMYHISGSLRMAAGRFEQAEHDLTLAYEIQAGAVKEFDWTTEQCIHSLRKLYASWPGHDEQLRTWCLHTVKGRLMLAHAHEQSNLPDVLGMVVDQCAAAGFQVSRTEILDLVWERREELAAEGHARRAAFHANFARACMIENHEERARAALAIAESSVVYATEREVADGLIAAARAMIDRP